MGNAFFPDATLTEDIYWAHQPPAVRALRTMQDADRGVAAKKLADQGYAIDVPIMVYGWSAVTTMGIRKQIGYTWVPSGNQANVLVIPGASVPGLPDYDPLHPPPGSIKVSIDAADYPAFDPPPPPPPPLPTNVVGKYEFGNIYTFGPGAKNGDGSFTVTDGQTVSEGGHTYLAHRATGLMGESLFFEMKS